MKTAARKRVHASTPKVEPWIVPTSKVESDGPLYLVYSLDKYGRPDKLHDVAEGITAPGLVASLRTEGIAAVAMRIERLEMSEELLSEAEIQRDINEELEDSRKRIPQYERRLRSLFVKKLADDTDGIAIANLRMKIIERYRKSQKPNRRKPAKAKAKASKRRKPRAKSRAA